ncbi:ribosome silencing factor [Bryobacter aggregatus]|uniref:ribosome silencing factor n=1 Tax=Bryobacter aggregatus TaxID=360054 RepID=UPI00192E438C|nr:ribosome silencing factor [Bryobacter aggregatus]
MSNTPEIVHPEILAACRAAESKKALDLKILDLRNISSFTDYFLLCSGSNIRQNQAISDEIAKQLLELGLKATSVEGYGSANWILMDFGDFIVHIFSEESRGYYDLERLWGVAPAVAVPEEPVATS